MNTTEIDNLLTADEAKRPLPSGLVLMQIGPRERDDTVDGARWSRVVRVSNGMVLQVYQNYCKGIEAICLIDDDLQRYVDEKDSPVLWALLRKEFER